VALLEDLTESWAGAIEFIEETDEQLVRALRDSQADRVRLAAPGRLSDTVLAAAGEMGGIAVCTPVSAEGRLELLWYLREQSISVDYHRYGNLGMRANEERAPVL
jgi:RHH-type proline utilization regulon transcriptional repressor/proline dehydrogenase/delta 1-pyrroline-5-carboxylate dehydrogenase